MKRAIALLAALALSGCATYVKSIPDAKGSGPGIRYSLPAPFLMVTPKPDGSLEVTTVNLPDPDATYTLETKSLVSSYALDVQIEHQMLKSISMNPKSDLVAAATVDSLGAYRKAQIEAREKAEDAAKKQDADDQKALADATLAVELADDKVAQLTALGAAADKTLDAKLAASEAKIKLKALERAQDSARGRMTSADAPDSSRAGAGPVAAGAMLFRIVPEGKGVKLVAVRGPSLFATSTATMLSIGFTPSGPVSFSADANGVRKAELTYSRPLSAIINPILRDENNPGVALSKLKTDINFLKGVASPKVTIILDPATPIGRYGLTLDMVAGNGTTTTQALEIVVVK